ncbi:DNA/RNA nuclease SfsA [Larsenimonas rhizosphaerae]|uniref:DNA/RNA nuclease SfsA n=1 Tax=Larsenimonas rhizosphaerae TaxID=2944682 RepID=UPI003899691A
MYLNGLIEGRLVKRYKRFLADIVLWDGRAITAHCPNTGSMRSLDRPGARVWVSASDNPARKLAWTWERVELPGGAVASVHTGRANALVAESLKAGRITLPLPYNACSPADTIIRREVQLDDSRIDFCVSLPDEPSLFMEVKQVTLREEDGRGYFPSSVTRRGQRHLEALTGWARQGGVAVLLFCVARDDVRVVCPARHIDAGYGLALDRAVESGVHVLAYGCRFDGPLTLCDRPLSVAMS